MLKNLITKFLFPLMKNRNKWGLEKWIVFINLEHRQNATPIFI